jgi:linalool 8-monooxygenase
MYMARTATRNTRIGDTSIEEDQLVVLWHISGNRDEAGNEHPDVFDVTRARVNHTSFGGGGIHFCLGNQLARLELKILFAEFLRRIPDTELAGPVRRQPSNIFHWMLSVPVRFTPA